MQDAEALARRAQQHAQHRGHRPLGDALGHRQFGVFLDAVAEDRLAAADAAVGQALAELEAAAGSPRPATTARGSLRPETMRLELELVLRPFGQHDGAALGVEHGDGVVQNRVEKVFFLLDVAEVVAGPEQGDQLVAGAGELRLSKASPCSASSQDDLAVPSTRMPSAGRAGVGRLGLFLDGLDDDGDLAELQQVARPQRPLAVAEPDAVEAGAVGAAQVAHAPAAVGGARPRRGSG